MDDFSRWRDEDILGLIPGLREATKDPSKFDGKLAMEKIRALIARMDAHIAGEQGQNIEAVECGHLESYPPLMRSNEAMTADLNRILIFTGLTDHHYGKQTKQTEEALLPLQTELFAFIQRMNAWQERMLMATRAMDESAFDKVLKLPDLPPYGRLLKQWREAPAPNAGEAAQIDLETWHRAHAQLAQAENPELPPEEQRSLFVQGITGALRYRIAETAAYGFSDTLARFQQSNPAPPELIARVAQAAEQRGALLAAKFRELDKVLGSRTRKRDAHTYSWQEAGDIVVAAYTKLDPKLGALARRALDEGWVLAKEKGVDNPCTLGGTSSITDPQSHPFCRLNFDGDAAGVITLGHEMGHVLQLYLAGQKHEILAREPSLMAQETGSHFGERLVEEEMLARAKTPIHKATIRLSVLGDTLEATHIASQVLFEQDLYRLVQEKGAATPSYDEINALFHRRFDGLLLQPHEVHQMHLWTMLEQEPHAMAVYPINRILSGILRDKYHSDPETFRHEYMKIMQAGAQVEATEMWERLIGKKTLYDPKLFDHELDKLTARFDAITDELRALPELPPQTPTPPPVVPPADRSVAPLQMTSIPVGQSPHKKMSVRISWTANAQGDAVAPSTDPHR